MDNKRKVKHDRNFVSCEQKYELDYIKRKLKNEYPALRDKEIDEALECCCREVQPPRPRDKYMACMKKKLSISDTGVEEKEIEEIEDLEEIVLEGEAETTTGTAAGKPPSTPAPAKNSRCLYVVIAMAVVTILALGYALFFKAGQARRHQASARVLQMRQLAHKVQAMEAGVKTKQDEIFNLMREYKIKTGQASLGVNALDLSNEEREILEKKIQDEQDVSIKSMLEDILEKNEEIRELKEKIVEIENSLPSPHIVASGENHYKIAMNFLTREKKVEKERALKLIEQTDLIELVPGFKVWNFYTGTEYGTFVTRGNAAIAPETKPAKQAIPQRDKLLEEIKILEKERDAVIQQLDLLNKEKETLIIQVSNLNRHRQQTVNSLSYVLDTQRNLKEKGILKGGFLKYTKLSDVSPENFPGSLDLRYNDQIAISASQLGIGKLKSVTLYPRFYINGTDYTIVFHEDKKNAVLTILDKAKFKNERAVISVK